MTSTPLPSWQLAGPVPHQQSRPDDDEDDEIWRRENIGRLLTNALRCFEARVIEHMEEAGHRQVTSAHLGATRHLDVGGTRLTEMARRASMTKQSMSELVAQLEREGLVSRMPDPTDGRARLVRFTAQGLAWLQDFRSAVLATEAEMAQRAGEPALEALKALLRQQTTK